MKMPNTTLKQLFNSLSQERLIQLAQTVSQSYPDLTYDTSTTASQLRLTLETTLRSHPELMNGIPGFENVTEFCTWLDSNQTLTEVVTTQATSPVVCAPLMWTQVQSLPVFTTVQQPTAGLPVFTTAHQPTAGPSTPSPNVQMSVADITSLVSTIMQQTSGQQQQLLQQIMQSSKQGQSSGVAAFLKEARHKSLSFSGSSSENLQRFLTKLETLFQGFHLSDSDKVTAVGDLLTGDAEIWFSSRQHSFNTWKELRDALKKTYQSHFYQTDLRRKILTMRQSASEKVSHFISKVRLMNQELDEPMVSSQLIPIVMANLHHRFLPLLGMREKDFSGWEDLEQSCLKAESIVEQQEKALRFQKSFQSKINSTEVETEIGETDETSVEVSALKLSSSVVCYGCKQTGHFQNACPQGKRYASGNISEERLVTVIEKVVREVLKEEKSQGNEKSRSRNQASQ